MKLYSTKWVLEKMLTSLTSPFMKRTLVIPLPVFVLFFRLTCSGADLSGEWEYAGKLLSDVSYARITLKVDGSKLSGSLNELTLEGTIKGDQLSFAAKRPNGNKFGEFTGNLKGDEIEGTATGKGDRPITWTARRSLMPPATPRIHDFEPTEFHRVFSDAIAPALHIFPGDTVRTWTVDAGGVDSNGVRRSLGGNPETGPFFIEGALPGDTVVIRLNRVRLNRDSAVSGNRTASSALAPWYVQQTKYNDDFDSNWILDREKGIGRLKKPSEHLKNYSIPLRPMLGCIAVAPPAHQAFRTGYLGSYGGNMDYNQIREGTTVSLPVYARGALLFVGDGHAAQGDGELTGDALETSMQVEFTVNLLKGKSTGGPRAENEEYLMAMGIANSMHEAVQSATTELTQWLEQDYQLDPNEAAIVIGTSMQYNIAELVDPLVHVVAKIRKESLAGLKEGLPH